MRFLLDEDVPLPAVDLIRRVLVHHKVDYVQGIGWSRKKDTRLVVDAGRRGFDVIITNDSEQFNDPDEMSAIRASGLHHVRYSHRHPGVRGLGLAMGSLVSALPDIADDLAAANGQRLVRVVAVSPNGRFELVDPSVNPPIYWPR